MELALLTPLDSGAGNYAVASVTLARTIGADADDAFGARGKAVFTAGGDVIISRVTVGTLTNGGSTGGEGFTQRPKQLSWFVCQGRNRLGQRQATWHEP